MQIFEASFSTSLSASFFLLLFSSFSTARLSCLCSAQILSPQCQVCSALTSLQREKKNPIFSSSNVVLFCVFWSSFSLFHGVTETQLWSTSRLTKIENGRWGWRAVILFWVSLILMMFWWVLLKQWGVGFFFFFFVKKIIWKDVDGVVWFCFFIWWNDEIQNFMPNAFLKMLYKEMSGSTFRSHEQLLIKCRYATLPADFLLFIFIYSFFHKIISEYIFLYLNWRLDCICS